MAKSFSCRDKDRERVLTISFTWPLGSRSKSWVAEWVRMKAVKG